MCVLLLAKRAHSFFVELSFILCVFKFYIRTKKREQIFEKSIAKQNKCSYNVFVTKLRNERRNERCNTVGIHCKGEVREVKYVYNTNRNDNRREIRNFGGCGQV